MKKLAVILFTASVFLSFSGCTPFDKLYSHELASGYFRMQRPGQEPSKVYIETRDDTIAVYPIKGNDKSKIPDNQAVRREILNSVKPGSYLYGSKFTRTSIDIDLSTVLLKYRPGIGDLEPQLNANVNGIFYLGFRRDFFRIVSHVSPVGRTNSFIRHTGFDFGPFAGIGITPVNPTVTSFRTMQEYDGIVFQKGFAVFGTFENMSLGLSVGFDNLLDKSRKIWVYNNKPWFGLVVGIANF